MKTALFALFLTSLMLNIGCNKGDGTFYTTSGNKIDSIIGSNNAFHLIYDSSDRVVETVYKIGDTIESRNIYHYHGQQNVPFERQHFYRANTTPDYVSVFTYNANNKKIYDSAYSTMNTNTCVAHINYDIPNKICVVQDQSFDAGVRAHNWETDTLFLNGNNIDSVRRYLGASQTIYGNWNYWCSYLLEQYGNTENMFSRLSISTCTFYQLTNINFGFIHANYMSYPFFDAFNTNNFNVVKLIYPSPYTGYNSTLNRTLNFDVNNLRITENVTQNGFLVDNWRFVYK